MTGLAREVLESMTADTPPGARRRTRGDRRGRGLRGRQARWVRKRRDPQRQRRPTDVLSVGTRRRRRVSRASQTPGADRCSGESDPPPSGNPNSMSVIRRRPQSASTPDRMAPLAPHSSLRPGAGPDSKRSRSARSGGFSGKRGPSLGVPRRGARPPGPTAWFSGKRGPSLGVPLASPSRAVGHLSRHPGVTSVTSVRCAVGPAASLYPDRPLTCGFGGTPDPGPRGLLHANPSGDRSGIRLLLFCLTPIIIW